MKDTLRLILFLECNLKCSYCCNENINISKHFVKKKFEDIDFTKYKNVCITGGEPFLRKDILYSVLNKIPTDKKIYIYTNGMLINDEDLRILIKYPNIDCFNIGLHFENQLNKISTIEYCLPVRWMIEESKLEKFHKQYPSRLVIDRIKTFKIDDCEMLNEDWILLES